jgi:hypothetical protein
MKLKRKHGTFIILGIGFIFIIFGLLQFIFKFEIDEKLMDRASFILMMIAVVIFVGNRKRKDDTDDDSENTESDNSDSE